MEWVPRSPYLNEANLSIHRDRKSLDRECETIADELHLPIGFPEEYWTRSQAEHYLDEVIEFLKPDFLEKRNINVYKKRAQRLGCDLLEIKQTHLGTDGGIKLIKELLARLDGAGVDLALGETVQGVNKEKRFVTTDKRQIGYKKLLIAPGRKGFNFLQEIMNSLEIPFVDNIVDIGIRIETRLEHYPIVRDYYDPKFYFPEKVRTFCTNSGNAHVVRTLRNQPRRYMVLRKRPCVRRDPAKDNGLVNFCPAENRSLHCSACQRTSFCPSISAFKRH